MKTLKNSIALIFSAELSTLTETENNDRTNLMMDMLSDCNIEFDLCTGVYKGTEETSFIVFIEDTTTTQTVTSFAFSNFQQESILLNLNGRGILVYNNPDSDGPRSIEDLGFYKDVTAEEAKKLDAYTNWNDTNFIYSH